MQILLIRHGESEADLLNVHEGRADFELTERGHRQAAAMADYVGSHYSLTRLYASPLKRAAQTAGHLSEKTGLPVLFEPDLMEHNKGLLAGLSWEEADRRYPEIQGLPVELSVYGQESDADFRSRAVKALNRILAESEPDSIVAVVTHGGMINQLYGVLFQIPLLQRSVFCTADTGIHVWELSSRGCRVKQANLHEHIQGI